MIKIDEKGTGQIDVLRSRPTTITQINAFERFLNKILNTGIYLQIFFPYIHCEISLKNELIN